MRLCTKPSLFKNLAFKANHLCVYLIGLLFLSGLILGWPLQAEASPTFNPSLPIQPVWRVLLLVYPSINVDYTESDGTPRHLTYTMSNNEVMNGIRSFQQFLSTAHDYSEGEALLRSDIIYVTRPIDSLSQLGTHNYWVSPSDITPELDQYAPPGAYDSVLVYWPRADLVNNQWIPSPSWGLGMGPSSWSNGATYATVHSGPDYWWGETESQVWLHEWLHGVCSFYASKGYPMPAGDADGGGSHGYVSSPTTGWADYYRDLMTGWVLDDGSYKGITAAAWRSGTILGRSEPIWVDYFITNTTASYQKIGTVAWQGTPTKEQYITLGTVEVGDNKIYLPITIQNNFTIIGRLYVPDSNVGMWDSVAVALRNDQVEYWVTLAYGTQLVEKNHISIIRNDVWGDLYPLSLSSGWYTVKVLLDYQNNVMWMKAWADGDNEPATWQTARVLDPDWTATQVGFRHYGQGTRVDDLVIIEEMTLDNKVYLPLIVR